ncbi:MAG: c-type cytochrome [Planctomycetota bacterium]|jgi:mono/diheme cytochrome c family protein
MGDGWLATQAIELQQGKSSLMRKWSKFGAVLLVLLVGIRETWCAPLVPGFERFARHAQAVDGSQVLLTELSCTACHAAVGESLAPKRGPDLRGAGRGLQREWVRTFVLAPQQTKPGTTMPALLHELPASERDRAADALVAFLATQRRAFPELKSTASAPVAVDFWNKGDVQRGRTLYHTVGCVACHKPDANYETGTAPASSLETLLQELTEEELRELGLTDAARPVPSVPLPELNAKYSPQSLTHFLLNPERTRPAGRMPSLKLSPAEAADIAAWLLRNRSGRPADSVSGSDEDTVESPDDDSALTAEGKRLFVSLRCSNCHAADGVTQKRPAKQLDQLNSTSQENCIASAGRHQASYDLNDTQQAALKGSLQRDRAGESAVGEPQQQVELRLQQLNCYGCHERDGRGGVGPRRRAYFEIAGHVDLGDEGRIPPPLTGVGSKLKSSWLQKVLSGQGDVRHHMLARMPVFASAAVKQLPTRLARADQFSSAEESDVFGDTQMLADAGRELLDTGCVQCHPIRGERLPGVVGIDLNGVAARVHPQWFHDFLLNPASLKKRTRMPTFFPNGRSANQELLEGDVERQIAAMWAYVKDIANQPLPEKIEKGKIHNFELVPNERPIVLRTFLRDAGPHGIAVGFPQKLHLAFDAERVRVAQFWKGRFLDAHGTWFNRFTPLAAPLGTNIVSLPDGIPFATVAETEAWPENSDDSAACRFRGYRLDESGTPEFLYHFSAISVRDRLTPDGSSAIVRRLVLTPADDESSQQTVWFRVLTGESLTKRPDGSVVNNAGLSVRIAGFASDDVVLRSNDIVDEWRVPVDATDETIIEVRYQW